MEQRCPPAFLVTIDTEGDDLWSCPRKITTNNVAFLPRFQRLCEAHGVRPTWLVNYEMATDDAFVRFGRDLLQRDTAEIGMHLHAWNSPPLVPLTSDDFLHQPFLTDFPADVAEEKITFMTSLLRDRFESQIVSHRAGRWAFNAHYARTLAKLGYLVDCSVCPHVSWAQLKGDPAGCGGPDYRRFPARPYLLNLDHIDQPGDSNLLELPMSIVRSPLHRIAPWAYRAPFVRRWAWRQGPDRLWLYPNGSNLQHLLHIVEEAKAKRRPYLEMVIHSSELMPLGSPNTADPMYVEQLYQDLHAMFSLVQKTFVGMTLSEYRQAWMAARAETSSSQNIAAKSWQPRPSHIKGELE